MIMDLSTVSAFMGAYRLQVYDYLSKAYVVCFVGSLNHTLSFWSHRLHRLHGLVYYAGYAFSDVG